MAHKRAQGQRIGSIPFGYRLADDGIHLDPEHGEQEVLLLARDLRNAGLSLRAVARELASRGFRSRTGRVFGPKQISRMVTHG